MTDIKFMDISQNDNPATTDSILVGNKDNGLKRTTLGKLGDMFAVHNLFHIEKVNCIITTNTNQYQISAKDVEGYQFAFWIGSASNGFVCPSYIDTPDQANAAIWVSNGDMGDLNPAVNGTNCFTAYAVYVKSSLA